MRTLVAILITALSFPAYAWCPAVAPVVAPVIAPVVAPVATPAATTPAVTPSASSPLLGYAVMAAVGVYFFLVICEREGWAEWCKASQSEIQGFDGTAN